MGVRSSEAGGPAPHRTIDDVVARIDGVTMNDIAEVAAEYMDPVRWLTVRLGPNH